MTDCNLSNPKVFTDRKFSALSSISQCTALQRSTPLSQPFMVKASTFLTLDVETFPDWHKVGEATIFKLGKQLTRNLWKVAQGPHHQGMEMKTT